MRMVLRCKIVYSPDKLDLEAVPIFCGTVGGATEARGDAVDVTSVCHRVDDPVAAGLDADARLVDGDAGGVLGVCNGSHLTDAEAGPQDPDDRLTESRHHALDLVEVAAGELGRRDTPEMRLFLLPVDEGDGSVEGSG